MLPSTRSMSRSGIRNGDKTRRRKHFPKNSIYFGLYNPYARRPRDREADNHSNNANNHDNIGCSQGEGSSTPRTESDGTTKCNTSRSYFQIDCESSKTSSGCSSHPGTKGVTSELRSSEGSSPTTAARPSPARTRTVSSGATYATANESFDEGLNPGELEAAESMLREPAWVSSLLQELDRQVVKNR